MDDRPTETDRKGAAATVPGKTLDPKKIEELLGEDGRGITLHYRYSVDSTNDWAKRESLAGEPDGGVYIADTQTAGKGRRGRSWKSPALTSVAMSILLRPELPPEDISMLTLVMGMAAADGMSEASGLKLGVKWPNDVVCGGKKLCGILTELIQDTMTVVIGIGLNVNVPSFPEELAGKATSLSLETGRLLGREEVTAEVLRFFFRYEKIFLETQDMTGLLDRYNRILVNTGQRVRVLDPAAPFTGTALRVNRRGDLLVRRDDSGTVEEVFAGEVSVRGIYGEYV